MTTPTSVPDSFFLPFGATAPSVVAGPDSTTPSNVPATTPVNVSADLSLFGREGGEGGDGLTPSIDLDRSIPHSSQHLKGEPLGTATAGKGKPLDLLKPTRSIREITEESLRELLRATPSKTGTPTFRQPAVLPTGDLLEVSGAGTPDAPKLYFKLSRFRTEEAAPWPEPFLATIRSTLGGRLFRASAGTTKTREWVVYRYDLEERQP